MIIDAHAHLGSSPQFHFPDTSVRTVLAIMDELHIDRAVCCHLGMLQHAWEIGYEESLQAYRESQGRIVCYAAFDPWERHGLQRVARCLDRDEFVGIKIHPSMHGCFADDERYDPVWQLAAERQVPLLTHSWDLSDQNPTQKYSFPSRFETFVTRYPEVPLILGHAGGRYRGHVAAAALARTYANVFLDLAGDCYTLGLVEYLVQEAGSDKVLYGSDFTWIDPRTQLGMVLDADVTLDDKRKIMCDNARRLFQF